ncbi:mechanosensitive ion channel family protein [Pseudohongiella sp. SYSU M77423]|uniref:mechanosensitive ion channel family protein n=1 Tax=Pseudohongiella sp. SYSU M77423 TaxID=3042312 RepID=UPI00248173EE|nr:mechanosensitive ion channel family protein [Pseudohongiella sp. SYSU M77423]MDH7942726.1 mechanosensitive ion channel family protein [Pseudohongiella sp. SYSU M77423]
MTDDFLLRLPLPPLVNEWLASYPWLSTLAVALLVLLAAWLLDLFTRQILVNWLMRRLQAPAERSSDYRKFKFIPRLAHVVPALVITFGVALVPGLPEGVIVLVRNVANAFIVLTLALALSGVLDMINHVYSQRPDALDRPIKGYLQVANIVIFAVAVLLMIATLLDRSPLILLSGLGALAAVLMLVFQDTILSLVASVQITSNDMIRVGDWIEMPQLNADGDVIDIALHTVKVQNWDKTITTIPTKRFISDSFKNWRGMEESGGRRIKRSLFLDQTSVTFLDNEQKSHLSRFTLLRDYLATRQQEIDEWNAALKEHGQVAANTRRVTNLGTFRAYVANYLKSHPRLRQDMTQIVRHLSPGPEGLPLEVYCFTNTTQWVDYEGIQSDIFDHLLSILPEFGLRVFQAPSGVDMRAMTENFFDREQSRSPTDTGKGS